jgi:hypothetical protein
MVKGRKSAVVRRRQEIPAIWGNESVASWQGR